MKSLKFCIASFLCLSTYTMSAKAEIDVKCAIIDGQFGSPIQQISFNEIDGDRNSARFETATKKILVEYVKPPNFVSGATPPPPTNSIMIGLTDKGTGEMISFNAGFDGFGLVLVNLSHRSIGMHLSCKRR